jgi:hypothetical protein
MIDIDEAILCLFELMESPNGQYSVVHDLESLKVVKSFDNLSVACLFALYMECEENVPCWVIPAQVAREFEGKPLPLPFQHFSPSGEVLWENG